MLTKFIYLALIACVKCCLLTNSSTTDNVQSIDNSIKSKSVLPDSIDVSSSNINELNNTIVSKNSTSNSTDDQSIDNSKLRKLTISNGKLF